MSTKAWHNHISLDFPTSKNRKANTHMDSVDRRYNWKPNLNIISVVNLM